MRTLYKSSRLARGYNAAFNIFSSRQADPQLRPDPYPELICYLKGQDYKVGDSFIGVKPSDHQIHNEFMVADCQQNVYTEYLLLFKYAVWNDVEEIYKKFIQEGYVIYKPPTEFKDS
jgi:ethanolamine ammonia-lyase large subunit